MIINYLNHTIILYSHIFHSHLNARTYTRVLKLIRNFYCDARKEIKTKYFFILKSIILIWGLKAKLLQIMYVTMKSMKLNIQSYDCDGAEAVNAKYFLTIAG